MSWNYRVVKRIFFKGTPDEETVYAIHEMYYDPDGHTTEPVTFQADSKRDLLLTLDRAMLALFRPVIDYDTGKEIDTNG